MISKLFRVLKWILLVAVSLGACLYGVQTFGWVQFFGWIYSGAFALSALPQALRSKREGHSKGVADGTLAFWLIGEIAGLIYGFGLMQLPIIANCLVNTIFVGVIAWYRVFPRDNSQL